MTPHENALILIKGFEYNARQVSQVLGVTTQTIDKKIKLVNNNKFSESDFQKLIFHFQQKIEKQSKTLKTLPFPK